MTLAKDKLLSGIKYFSHSVSAENLQAQGIVINEHNGAAQLLRKGIGVVAFNILEEYIKNRTSEMLSYLSNSNCRFSDLSESLQSAAIKGAIDALSERLRLEKKAKKDWKSIGQEEAQKIASTGSEVYEISNLAFMSANSNVNSSDITSVLKAFDIDGGWATLLKISKFIGGGTLDLSQAFENAAERRHKSAHVPNFNYEHGWLISLRNEILDIASAFDIILSAKERQISKNKQNISQDILECDFKIVFLQSYSPNLHKQFKGVNGRSYKNWKNKEEAMAAILNDLKLKNIFAVELDDKKRITNWHT